MPITNQPISTQRTLGEGATMFGIFTQTMLPGLTLGMMAWAIGLGLFDGQHQKAAPIGFAVVGGYWIYVGNDREKAWRNLSRHVPLPMPYIGSSTNVSILNRYETAHQPLAVTATVQKGRIRPSESPGTPAWEAPSRMA
jgi:hypothetical protein